MSDVDNAHIMGKVRSVEVTVKGIGRKERKGETRRYKEEEGRTI